MSSQIFGIHHSPRKSSSEITVAIVLGSQIPRPPQSYKRVARRKSYDTQRSSHVEGKPSPGEGLVTTTSGILNNALYSFGSSTGNDPCTSPSEMLAASVAACMSLMLVQELSKVHLKHGDVRTESVLKVEEKKGRWEITNIELHITALLAEMDEEKFHQASKMAKSKCPISRALKVPIKITTKLEAMNEAAVATY
ncbi:MAG: hypothetical protein DMG68_06815 [Acidobacteria bacterium]|nr:MAG: hypothetical protein DMG68_06815 [Acidobacteriota bacterium]